MRQIAYREALREAMSEEMRRDDRVFLMGEEVAEYNGAYKVSQGMLDEFGPKRVIDTPISELGFTAIGVGAAQNGLRPVLEYMTWNFAALALDQILNTASKMLAMSGGQVGCPIVFRGPNGSAGQLGAQHSTAFESYYANIPGLKVVSPSNGYDAKGLLKQAIRYEEDPVIFMESEVSYGDKSDVPEEEYYIELGKAKVARPGTDVTIVSYNKMMKISLAAAEELQKENVNAEVIDLRTIRPLDWIARIATRPPLTPGVLAGDPASASPTDVAAAHTPAAMPRILVGCSRSWRRARIPILQGRWKFQAWRRRPTGGIWMAA